MATRRNVVEEIQFKDQKQSYLAENDPADYPKPDRGLQSGAQISPVRGDQKHNTRDHRVQNEHPLHNLVCDNSAKGASDQE